MSYKKFNDLQNLYEGVVSEANEIDEYSELVYNVIIAEMVYRGHSESVIRTYVENISEEQILEKVESFFSLEEFNLNEGQTDLLFSFYQEQQVLSENKVVEIIAKNANKIKNLKTLNVLKNIKGSSSKLKNMVMGILRKDKSGQFMGGAKTGIDLNKLKGAKDGPGLLKRLQNLKKSAGNQLNKVKSKFDKKVTKTSDTLLGPDGKPLKTTKTVNPINKKNAAIVGGLGVVGGAAALTGGDKKKKDDDSSNNVTNKDKNDISKENQLQDVLNNKDNLQKLEPPKVKPPKVEPPKPTNPSGKELPKPRAIGKGKGEINPNSARGQMIARNKEIFGTDAAGNDRVDKLRNKNAAFQSAKKSGSNYSMKDFVKDFPDSNAAKDRRKSKRVTSVMDMESYDAKGEVFDEGAAAGAAALKLGGMVAPKIPGALKAITAGAATGASILGIKKKAEEGRPARRRKQTKTIDQVKADNETRKEKERARSAHQREVEKDLEDDIMGRHEYEQEFDRIKNSPEAKQFEADRIRKGREAFKKGTKQESYDAYDLVLNYIIETEQASTIEEANYIMVEMDQNTIYSIIKENTVNRADIIGGTKAAKNAQQGIGKYKPGVGVTKDFQLVPNFRIKA